MAATGGSQAPVAARIDKRRRAHGFEWNDPYDWMSMDSSPDTDTHLRAEARFATRRLGAMADRRNTFFDETHGREPVYDDFVQHRSGDYTYFTRLDSSRASVFMRYDLEGNEEVVLDSTKIERPGGPKTKPPGLGTVSVSPDHNLVAYTVDVDGSETYRVRVRSLQTGKRRVDTIPDVDSPVVWDAASAGFFYTRSSPGGRSHQVMFHQLGEARRLDRVVFGERRKGHGCNIGSTADGRFLTIASGDIRQSEIYALDLDKPLGRVQKVLPVSVGHETHIEHDPFRSCFIATRRKGDATEVVAINDSALSPTAWPPTRTIVKVPSNEMVLALAPHPAGVTVMSITEGRSRVRFVHRRGSRVQDIPLPEVVALASVQVDSEPTNEPGQFRPPPHIDNSPNLVTLRYESLRTPSTIISYDLDSGEVLQLHGLSRPTGFDAQSYVVHQDFATANDGVQIPITLFHHRDVAPRNDNPMVMWVYGSYGTPTVANFWSSVLPLVQRGGVVALAHVRGGGDNGYAWHDAAVGADKPRSVYDAISCLEHLGQEGWATPSRSGLWGESAGAVVAASVANKRPDLVAGVALIRPFVDVVSGMSEAEDNRVHGQYSEFGNPSADPNVLAAMFEYCPIAGAVAQTYPRVYVQAGRHDVRTEASQAAKYVATIRNVATNPEDIVLRVLDRGHSSATTWKLHRRDRAEITAFLADCIDLPEHAIQRNESTRIRRAPGPRLVVSPVVELDTQDVESYALGIEPLMLTAAAS